MPEPEPRSRSQPTPGPDLAETAVVQRRTIAVLIGMQISGTVGVGVAPSIGVLLAEEVTDHETWAGLAPTASTLGAALIGLPLGNLAARYGRRIALATGWWAAAAAGGALLVAAAQWSLLIPLFLGLPLIGIGTAVSLQARFAATDLAEPQRKARSLALVVWVGTLGSVLGPNLGVPGEFVSRATGLTVFASAFLITAVFLAIAGCIAFAFLRPDPLVLLGQMSSTPQAAVTGRRSGRIRMVLAELRTNRYARYALIAILTAQTVMVAVMTMTPVHVAHQRGSITVIGFTISLHIAGMYGISPVVGIIADRYRHLPRLAADRRRRAERRGSDHGLARPARCGLVVRERRRLRAVRHCRLQPDQSVLPRRGRCLGESLRSDRGLRRRPAAGGHQLYDAEHDRHRHSRSAGLLDRHDRTDHHHRSANDVIPDRDTFLHPVEIC